jgi:hypothetical protein
MITTGLAVFGLHLHFPSFSYLQLREAFSFLRYWCGFLGITTCVIRQTLCRLRTLHSPDCHKCFTLLQGAYLEKSSKMTSNSTEVPSGRLATP